MGRSPASCAASDSLRSNASNNNVHRPQPAEAAICIWNMLSECLKHNPSCSCQKYFGSESIFVGKQTSGELKIRHKLKLLQVVHRAIAFVNHEKLWAKLRKAWQQEARNIRGATPTLPLSGRNVLGSLEATQPHARADNEWTTTQPRYALVDAVGVDNCGV
jgi:uncharacterized membrane protein